MSEEILEKIGKMIMEMYFNDEITLSDYIIAIKKLNQK